MHQQMQEPSAFSQHQAMERDDTGIVAPSNTFHQPLPTNFMDFPKVHCTENLFKNIILVVLLVPFKKENFNL